MEVARTQRKLSGKKDDGESKRGRLYMPYVRTEKSFATTVFDNESKKRSKLVNMLSQMDVAFSAPKTFPCNDETPR